MLPFEIKETMVCNWNPNSEFIAGRVWTFEISSSRALVRGWFLEDSHYQCSVINTSNCRFSGKFIQLK
jgi:hypothetical protein